MKKPFVILLALAMLTLAFVGGCSNDAATPASTLSKGETPEFVKLPERLDNSLNKIVSVTKFIYAAQGGTLRLLSTYKAAPDSHLVTIDVTLALQPGDLPYDASLTLSVDDVLFLMTFGPDGVVFNRAVNLSAKASGLDGGTSYSALKLYYINNGVWEMPGSNGILYAGTLDAEGQLFHFSQYAFGRAHAHGH